MAKKGILLKEEVGFAPIAPVAKKGKPASSEKKVNSKSQKK